MSNSLRHAQATSGSVSFQSHNRTWRFAVEDNGLGFNTADVKISGNGLRNMAARARRLGARLEVLSREGKGTRIIFEIYKKDADVSESA
jgi:NarL family two-component system sensor histidine kinase LiaS